VWHIAHEELIDVSVDMFEPVVQADLDDDRRLYRIMQELLEGYLLELDRRKHDDVEKSAPLDGLATTAAYNCLWPFYGFQLAEEKWAALQGCWALRLRTGWPGQGAPLGPARRGPRTLGVEG
jgi:hypothetical protein